MKSDLVYLRHILDAVQKIESYVSVGQETFMSTSHWQDAVIRQLEIIGEATKRLSPDVRRRYPQIPWKRIAGLRDVLIPRLPGGGYFSGLAYNSNLSPGVEAPC